MLLSTVAVHRTALRNIHSLLRPGGEALLLFVVNSPMYDAYIAMQNNPRWCDFMKDANSFISPYHRSTDPVLDFSTVLRQMGFNVHACRLEHFRYCYPTMQDFKDSTMVLNPFLKRVPEELQTTFINDFMTEYQREKVKYMSMVSSQESERNDTALYHLHLITHVEKHNQDVSFIVRSMYQPGLYVRSNAAQRECVSRMLREWAGRLRWSREEQEAVLDVGCGPGDVTAQLLLPRLPSSVRVLVGHDVSEEMVRHAAAAHAALAPRLCFLCTDIAARDLPATPLGACAQQLQGFHKVFSFYALHWVVDQRFMPPYKRSIDPVNDFSVVLQQAGFNIYSCRLEHFSYRYPTMQEFGDSTMVLNPFLKRVPEELKTIFINDFMREYQREKVKYMSMVSRQELEQNDTSLYHSVLITHVEKDNQDVS
ncbi:Uncharacterized protein GBIM_11965 [Gryllus bimaculatus]|nr:Uncharacterized protein GBIM_11965 [Gryllus bimaculatus]